MFFDDRLATVLRQRADGEAAARTQYRQLLDLLGDRRFEKEVGRDESMQAAAWLRLGALGELIPSDQRSAIIRDRGWRLRNPQLAAHLVEDEPEVASAAIAKANLSEDDWTALIPLLPIRARGFLRLRKDLPAGVEDLLEQLGVHDRGLPQPESVLAQPAADPTVKAQVSDSDTAPDAIDDIQKPVIDWPEDALSLIHI